MLAPPTKSRTAALEIPVTPSDCVTLPEMVPGEERLKLAVAVWPAVRATEFLSPVPNPLADA